MMCFYSNGSAEESEKKIEFKELNLYATAAILMDGTTGRVLYGKNETFVMPMVSTTKIMTCIVALENAELDEIVTASQYAASMPKVHLGMGKGDQFYLEDLLYSLMLESHNDSAVAIAEYIGSKINTEEPMVAFLHLMNEKANEICCENTFFLAPNGLDATATVTLDDGTQMTKTHATTASELGLIMRYCITQSAYKDMFLKITQCSSYSFCNVTESENGVYSDGNKTYGCTNHNALLTMMTGALSGKTGYTSNAGYCYVGAVKRDGNLYIVALLACGWPNHKSYKWSDMKTLIQYAMDYYTYSTFQLPDTTGKALSEIIVQNACGNGIGELVKVPIVVVEADSTPLEGLLIHKNEKIEVIYELPDYLEAPVTDGEQIGKISYQMNGKAYRVLDIVTTENADKIDFRWCFLKVFAKFRNMDILKLRR